jgi:putative ABC transport system substrate-binding protein
MVSSKPAAAQTADDQPRLATTLLADMAASTTRRQLFIGALAVAILAAPRAAVTQATGKVWRVGFLEPGAPTANSQFIQAFRGGLHALGYVEGQNVVIVDRWANGEIDRFPALLSELIQLKVDVIVVGSTAGALAAKAAVSTIPVVFVGVQDPLGAGLVASLARPEGNLTGFSLAEEDGLLGKRLEIFREIIPAISRLALIWNPASPTGASRLKDARSAATKFGMTLELFEVRDAKDLDSIFAAISKDRIDALMVIADPLTVRNRQRIVALAASNQVPAMYSFLEFVQVGGLVAYGPSVIELFRRASTYVDKVLRGAKPADLPVEQPTKFELVINLKTANALGVKIPQSLLLRADDVIQ